jgi:hypothetical protein
MHREFVTHVGGMLCQAIVLGLVFFNPGLSAAADVVWLGGEGSWFDAARWSDATVPNSAGTNVFVDGGAPATSAVVLPSDLIAIGSLAISAGDTFTMRGFSLGINGDLRLDGEFKLDNGSVFFGGGIPRRIDGNGTLEVTLSSATAYSKSLHTSADLEVGPNVTILTQPTGMADIGAPTSASIRLNNSGTISAFGQRSLLQLWNPRNLPSGRLEARAGGTLAFGGNYTNADITTGSLTNDSAYIFFSGQLDNRDHELVLHGTGTYAFYNATVLGGTLRWDSNTTASVGKAFTRTPDGVVVASSHNVTATFDGVTLASDLDVEGALSIEHQLTLQSQLTLRGGLLVVGSQFRPQLLTGNGDIVFAQAEEGTMNEVRMGSSSLRSTIDSGISIRTESGSGFIFGVFDNHGIISAETSDTFISIIGDQWRNMSDGLMRVRNGGTLYLGGTTTTTQLNPQRVRNEGGQVILGGSLDNTGADLVLDRTTGSWTLASYGLINGGRVKWIDGATLIVAGGTLNDVEVLSDLHVPAQTTLSLTGHTLIGSSAQTVQLTHEGFIAAGQGSIDVYPGRSWVVASTGGLVVQSGAVLRAHSEISMLGRTQVLPGGELVVDPAASFLQLAGLATIDGRLTATHVEILGGELNGSGVIQGDLQVGSRLRPGGYLPGKLTVSGTYSQGHDSELEIILDGVGAGEFSTLFVSGDAHFDGKLLLVKGAEYGPTVGDSFLIIATAGAESGAFSSLDLSGFDTGVEVSTAWSVDGLSVTITAVPEPSLSALSVTGLLLISVVAHRRRLVSHRPATRAGSTPGNS